MNVWSSNVFQKHNIKHSLHLGSSLRRVGLRAGYGDARDKEKKKLAAIAGFTGNYGNSCL